MSAADEPKILVLDTSGRVGQVASAVGARILASRQLDEARRHARDLAPTVADLLKERNWRPGDLSAIIVSKGPGSYTGLRVGLMSAKALAYATGCALIGVETFAVIALQTPADALSVEVIGDAQQDKVYVQAFRRPGLGDAPQPASVLGIHRLSDWLAQRDPQAWLTGPGLAIYGARLPESVQRVAEDLWAPRVDTLLTLGLERYRRGERDDLWAAEPIYGRPSAAEEKWQARGDSIG